MSQIINQNSSNNQTLFQSLENDTRSPAEVYNDFIAELQAVYNAQIQEIQNKQAQGEFSTLKEYQDAIAQLGAKYNEEINKLVAAYNTYLSTNDYKAFEAAANEVIYEMGALTPEQREALEIQKSASNLVKELEDEINDLISQLRETQSLVEKEKNLIEKLEKRLEDLQKSDPDAAKELAPQLAAAKSRLSNLEKQILGLTGTTSYDDYIEQLNEMKNKLEHSEIFNNINAGGDLSELRENLTALKENISLLRSNIDQISSTSSKRLEDINHLLNDINNIHFPKPEPKPWNSHGQISYFDMGSFQIWSLMDYSNPAYPQGIVDPKKFQDYLDSLFDQMEAAGVNQIDLAFGQFAGIDDLLYLLTEWDGDISNLPESLQHPSDPLLSLIVNSKIVKQDGSTTNAFSAFIKEAKARGIKIDLSIGGELAGAAKICKKGETPQGQAEKLAKLMDALGIDAVDFDLENTAITDQNTTEELREYFSKVHELLSAEGKESILTTEGSISDWVSSPNHPGSGFFHDVFYDDDGNSIFNDMFDGLNLMLYGGTTSYLDVDGETSWGIDDWLDVIGKENASKIHIGFEDGVDYSNQETNDASHHFDIRPGSTSGEAAAQIYDQIKKILEEKGYSSDLGEPFWWPQKDASHPNRYEPVDGKANFQLDTEKDFWDELNRLENGTKSSSEKMSDLIAAQRAQSSV